MHEHRREDFQGLLWVRLSLCAAGDGDAMNIFQLISDSIYNWQLRKSGQERPGEVDYVQGWGPDWREIDPYADEPKHRPARRFAKQIVTTLSQKEIEQ